MLLLLMLPVAAAQMTSRTAEIPDEDTRAWWRATEALSGDDLEGRDTGSPGYERAADLVARSFERNGLKPAGENGGWRQALRLDEVAVAKPGTRIAVGRSQLRLLHDITLRPSPGMPNDAGRGDRLSRLLWRRCAGRRPRQNGAVLRHAPRRADDRVRSGRMRWRRPGRWG
jgi:hypothetical protein